MRLWIKYQQICRLSQKCRILHIYKTGIKKQKKILKYTNPLEETRLIRLEIDNFEAIRLSYIWGYGIIVMFLSASARGEKCRLYQR